MTKPGMRLPAVTLSRIDGDSLTDVPLLDTYRHERVVMVGVIGAFTPVCTHEHAPKFVTGAGYLKSLGYDRVICIVPNDPWTVKAWADRIDPEGQVQFLADGNLDLAGQLSVLFDGRSLHLGQRSRRYLVLAKHGIIERLTVEASPYALTCTRPTDVLEPVVV